MMDELERICKGKGHDAMHFGAPLSTCLKGLTETPEHSRETIEDSQS
jgi:hypothetical protein